MSQQDFGCSPSTIGYLFLVVVIPNAVGSGVAGAWSDKYSKVKLIGIGMVALAAVIPCMAIFHSPSQLVYFCLVLAVVGFVAAIPLTPILPLMSAIVTAKHSRSFGQAYRCACVCLRWTGLYESLFARRR